MKTKDLIKKLQTLDPKGNHDLVAKSNDGYVYDIFGADLGTANEGIIEDDDSNPNCIILDAS